MTQVTVFHGTPTEFHLLQLAIDRNCTCATNPTGQRTTCCSAHALLLDQHALDRLLFYRRIGYRMLAQEYAS